MFDIGPLHLWLLFVISLVSYVLSIWAIVDAAKEPDATWQATRRSKSAWVAGLVIATVLGLGLIGALAYLIRVRPSLKRALSQAS